jgi:hypothetical protein
MDGGSIGGGDLSWGGLWMAGRELRRTVARGNGGEGAPVSGSVRGKVQSNRGGGVELLVVSV